MPTVIRIPANAQESRRRHGIKIGCCRICTCEKASFQSSLLISWNCVLLGLHLEFLTTKCGLLKIFELLLGLYTRSFDVKTRLECNNQFCWTAEVKASLQEEYSISFIITIGLIECNETCLANDPSSAGRMINCPISACRKLLRNASHKIWNGSSQRNG